MWRRVAFALSLAIAVEGLAAAALPAAPTAPEAAVQLAPNSPGGPYYALGCSSSHRNNDDPIVYPGQPGKSHNHTYIGNRSVDADTPPVSLLGGGSPRTRTYERVGPGRPRSARQGAAPPQITSCGTCPRTPCTS